MSRPAVLSVMLLLAACSRPDATPPATQARAEWTVSATAIGSTKFGQTVADFARGQKTAPDTMIGADCSYWWPAGGPAGLSLMVDSGKVVRADIDSTGPKTDKGIGLGAKVSDVEAAYPAAHAAPHKYNYDQGWRTLTVLEADSSAAIVFEVDSTTVRQIHAGRLPYALWVERCS